jgi:4-hydroxy-tetrahydrodipicolinate synthase
LAIYSGDDGLTLPMLAAGAVGVVSVTSHLAGVELSAMIDHYMSGRHAEALALHERLLPLMEGLFCTSNPTPVKAALELQGWPVGAPRLPLMPADSSVRDTLSTLMAALRPT